MFRRLVAMIDADPRFRFILFLLIICLSIRLLQVSSVVNDRLLRSPDSHAIAFLFDAASMVSEAIVVSLVGHVFLVRPYRQAEEALARSERRYRVLAEDSADLIVVIGTNDGYDPLRAAVARFLGHSGTEAEHFPMSRLVHPDDYLAAKAALVAVWAGLSRRVTVLRMIHANGGTVWVDATLQRIDHGDGRSEAIVVIRDVTLRQNEAEDLRQATLSAQRAKAEADEANRAKSEFLACMSHEIRTPLHSVIGFASLLLGQSRLDPDVKLYGERIRASGKALLTVVNDILDFSRGEAGATELKLEPFALFPLIDDSLSIVRREAAEKQLSLHIAIRDTLPKAVVGDEARLRQVLLNLLYNAIKFTPDGSVLLEIAIDHRPLAQRPVEQLRLDGLQADHLEGDLRLMFRIVDTGIGISADDLPRLFQRFAQVDSSVRRSYGGAGLGLAISKNLVETMGGDIGVESEKGTGSTFWFSVPLRPSEMPVDVKTSAPSSSRMMRRILLVEDVPLNQELICAMLRAGHHSVDVVGNGAEAIMAVDDRDYDLVLMDVQMPFMDGLTATRAIRELPGRRRHVPIVAMTANVLPEQMAMARDAGMNDVLVKPFSIEQLNALLARVDGRGARDALDDRDVLTKLESLLGQAKVRDLLNNMATSLDQRFLADPPEGGSDRAAFQRKAHASIAGCGMLGFTGFAGLCRELEHSDEAAFGAMFDTFKAETAMVVDAARRLAAPRQEATGEGIAHRTALNLL